MTRARAALLLLTLLAPLAAAAPAAADQAIATVDAPTPVVAAGTTLGWLTTREDGERVLAYRMGRAPVVETAVLARDDLDAGRDARGRVTFTWSECPSAGNRCVVRGMRPGQTRPTVLARVTRRGQPLVASLAGKYLVTARRVVARGGRRCSVPVVTRLGSSATPRRLQVGACGRIAALEADAKRVVIRLTGLDTVDGNSEEQARVSPLDGGRATLLTVTTASEAPNEIGGLGLRGSTLTLALPGGAGRVSQVRRIDLSTGRQRTFRAFQTLVGGFTSLGRARVAYLSARLLDPFSETQCTQVVPCTVVVGGDPAKERALPRRLDLDRDRRKDGPVTSISGRLTRTRVDGQGPISRSAVAGVPVELWSTTGPHFDDQIDPATPTGLRGVTDPQGRFTIALPAPASAYDYVARTADDSVPATGYLPTDY